MKKYIIKNIDGINTDKIVPAEVWDKTEAIPIDCFPWDVSAYKPSVSAKMLYSEKCFRIRFNVEEEHIRAVNIVPNGPVCQDSCVEWFVIPCPEVSSEYVNFELNPIGTMHIAIGKDRHNRRFLDKELFDSVIIWRYIDSPVWRLEYVVPFAFFDALYGKVDFRQGHEMKANFYKCGDKLRKPHWACWNNVGTDSPDFHAPKWFGSLVLG